jgi:hypothetical protein
MERVRLGWGWCAAVGAGQLAAYQTRLGPQRYRQLRQALVSLVELGGTGAEVAQPPIID